MIKNLSFKEYVESKNKLREAVKNIPQRTARYNMRKYGRLPIDEGEDDKQYINLKPKNTIVIHWLYEDFDNPTVVKLTFSNTDGIDENQQFNIQWTGKRLMNWLHKNAQEVQ